MYTKLFTSLLDSTIWSQEPHIRITWITILLLTDSEGYFAMPIPALARRACVTYPECQQAITALEAPDENSRSKDEGGKRIIRVSDDGPTWRVVNYLRYRSIRNDEDRKAYQREKQRQYRAKKRRNVTKNGNVSPTVNHNLQRLPRFTHTEADTEEESIVQSFLGWYSEYPRHEGRQVAERAWVKLSVAEREECGIKTPAWLRSKAALGTQPKFYPMPATFLNQKRWTDELPSVRKTKDSLQEWIEEERKEK